MRKITALELAQVRTFITNFMLDKSRHEKTFSELLAVLKRSCGSMTDDPSNDMRSISYAKDMANGRWNAPIIIKMNRNGLATAGIHRGIAYLLCVENGVSEDTLPAVFID